MMINDVPLESYLRGVVPHEVSPSWPLEALKAQACAARAFALGSRQPRVAWDVYCDVRDQAYVGVGIEDSRTDAAVRGTAGVCPTYGGKPIVATTSPAPAARPKRQERLAVATTRTSRAWTTRTTTTPPCTTGDRWAARRRRSADRWAQPARSAPSTRSSAARRRASSRRRSSGAAGRSTSTAVPAHQARAQQHLGRSSRAWASARPHGTAQRRVGRQRHPERPDYPALPAGAEVTLHLYYDGRWRSRASRRRARPRASPAATRRRYSLYQEPVSPTAPPSTTSPAAQRSRRSRRSASSQLVTHGGPGW